jgi:predicted transcriptional regulator
MTKHDALNFIEKNKTIQCNDLIRKFNLTESGARSYLHFLINQELSKQNPSGSYSLTIKGKKRLDWFEKNGCSSKKCKKCRKLLSENIIKCPDCGEFLDKKELFIEEAGLLPIGDKAGVHCPKCNELILSEKEAKRLGIN